MNIDINTLTSHSVDTLSWPFLKSADSPNPEWTALPPAKRLKTQRRAQPHLFTPPLPSSPTAHIWEPVVAPKSCDCIIKPVSSTPTPTQRLVAPDAPKLVVSTPVALPAPLELPPARPCSVMDSLNSVIRTRSDSESERMKARECSPKCTLMDVLRGMDCLAL